MRSVPAALEMLPGASQGEPQPSREQVERPPQDVLLGGRCIDLVLTEGGEPSHPELHPGHQRGIAVGGDFLGEELAGGRGILRREHTLDLRAHHLGESEAQPDVGLQGSPHRIPGEGESIAANPVEVDGADVEVVAGVEEPRGSSLPNASSIPSISPRGGSPRRCARRPWAPRSGSGPGSRRTSHRLMPRKTT